jgi:hypothetical protein
LDLFCEVIKLFFTLEDLAEFLFSLRVLVKKLRDLLLLLGLTLRFSV